MHLSLGMGCPCKCKAIFCTPISGLHDGALQQGSNYLVVMMDGDMAQSISCPIVSSLLVLQSEFKGQHAYLPMPNGIKVWVGKDIHQWIVVSLYHKWHICKVLIEVLWDTPLDGKELKFRAVVVFL